MVEVAVGGCQTHTRQLGKIDADRKEQVLELLELFSSQIH